MEIDRQGRVAVPQHLLAFAQLQDRLLVVGALERIELWNPLQWESRVRPAEADLLDPVDAVAAATDTGS